MSVIYKRGIIAKDAKAHHFKAKGINIKMMYKIYPNEFVEYHQLKFVFSKNELLGIIRTTCDGNTFAVDVQNENKRRICITTECKNLQEAKDILYAWFEYPNYPFFL